MKIKPEKRIYLNAHNTKIARQFQRELWKFFERRCLLKMDKIDLIASSKTSLYSFSFINLPITGCPTALWQG